MTIAEYGLPSSDELPCSLSSSASPGERPLLRASRLCFVFSLRPTVRGPMSSLRTSSSPVSSKKRLSPMG